MLPIKSLLNPQPDSPARGALSGSSSSQKPRKVPKDAPVFLPGKIQGTCRFPPYEERDEELAKHHKQFRLRPMGNIADFPRQIPYASDKKTFQQRTGRDSFNVFQYTFQVPGEEKEWHVLWDYNIGIVRMTHLFKCNGYSKTTPGRVLAQNNGLREICHSITGGALLAQGYWMPYHAAKALAATFCWKIRHALTPMFGPDFPAMCIDPEDKRRFGVMVIDTEITRVATEQANYFRSLENTISPRSALAPAPKFRQVREMKSFDNDEAASVKLAPIKYPRHRYADSIASARDSSTEPYSLSPKSQSPCSTFTPVNPPRSINDPPRTRVTSPKTLIRAISDAMRPVNESRAMSEESDTDSDGSSNVYSTPNCPSLDINMEEKMAIDGNSDIDTRRSDSDLTDSDEDWTMDDDNEDEDYRGSGKQSFGGLYKSKATSASPGPQAKKNPSRKSRPSRPPCSTRFAREVKAAEALLHLHKNELESNEAETEVDEKGTTRSHIKSRSHGGLPRGTKRRRASI
ncbi:hypothetical protein N7541_006962 [Penicillium brevicompactum]|uniref:HTH APSES-type domain-containing protein n=1 Tax=Penicillium brevicompactum TaxID=5074 RepID=A0A9W9QWF1_PENBR|nr:hypothetical protein N7541_006962 [Penicillium brevicompactum]